jgi:hypothetical protein
MTTVIHGRFDANQGARATPAKGTPSRKKTVTNPADTDRPTVRARSTPARGELDRSSRPRKYDR